MTYEAIHAALEDHATTVAGLPTLQKENTKNIAVAGRPFARTTLLPAESNAVSIGVTGITRLHGLLQVDLFYPADKGVTAANVMADAVVLAYKRGTFIQAGASKITIEMSWREAASIIESFYNVPVVVRWRLLA